MSNVHVFAASNHSLIYPTICRIGVHDVRDALREGFGDFLNNPSHLVFLGFIYPTVGFYPAFWTSNLNFLPLLYPRYRSPSPFQTTSRRTTDPRSSR